MIIACPLCNGKFHQLARLPGDIAIRIGRLRAALLNAKAEFLAAGFAKNHRAVEAIDEALALGGHAGPPLQDE